MGPNNVALLEVKWGILRLMEKERETINVSKKVLKRDKEKGQRGVIGRLSNDRLVGKNVVQITMGKMLSKQQWGRFGG